VARVVNLKLERSVFRKVLVANRGEIARRVMRTLRALGIASVAVYSDADIDAPHVREADEAYRLGPGPITQSYLHVEALLDAARASGAEAIHPGYGMLSEKADFAETCEAAGLTFIGPAPAAIRAMGSKLGARQLMREAGVPIVPGALSPCDDPQAAHTLAEELGYPVLVKASGGGGGIGMQVVRQSIALAGALESCRRVAERYFGDGTVYIEKYIERPRHIEIQVIGDARGHVLALHERECSIQRRHQKVIEEALSPAVTPELRRRMEEAAVIGAEAINYVNAGTLEFIVDEQGEFYFMEMNTRLQVEHPVTEMITGVDLVAEQLRVAAGEPLSFDAAPAARGHAIECRIYAEDPKRLLPSPGTIENIAWPELDHVRVDHGVEAGYTVTPYYDPMLAKVIVWGEARADARRRMIEALNQTRIDGIKTNIPVLLAIARHPSFASGQYDTGFIDSHGILASI